MVYFDDASIASHTEWTYILAGFFGVIVLIVICLGLLLYYALCDYHSLDACAAIVAGLPPAAATRVETTLTFQGVGYKLKGRQILQGITGMAPGGEILAIMGPSGCGKSTLVRVYMIVFVPWSSWIDGRRQTMTIVHARACLPSSFVCVFGDERWTDRLTDRTIRPS